MNRLKPFRCVERRTNVKIVKKITEIRVEELDGDY